MEWAACVSSCPWTCPLLPPEYMHAGAAGGAGGTDTGGGGVCHGTSLWQALRRGEEGGGGAKGGDGDGGEGVEGVEGVGDEVEEEVDVVVESGEVTMSVVAGMVSARRAGKKRK
jgi:hypothetical protein